MNRNKRGQSEIISTVLIILLVLAAIIIVWAVVTRIISRGGGTVEEKMQCTEVALSFAKDTVACDSTGKVKGMVKRGSDSLDKQGVLGINMKIIVGNTAHTGKTDIGVDPPTSLGSASFSGLAGGEPGKEFAVKVAAIVGAEKNIVCDPLPAGEINVDCEDCAVEEDCAAFTGKTKCKVAGGICVECLLAADCAAPNDACCTVAGGCDSDDADAALDVAQDNCYNAL